MGIRRPWPNSLAGPSSGSGKAGRLFVTLVVLLWFGVIVSRADTHYVAQGGQTPAGDYFDWTAAASNIQDAISKAIAGDTVLVSNGVYQTGGIINWPSGTVLTNRVAITNAITVRSANNDPTNTIIKGSRPNGPAAVRCVYLVNGSSLIGFTLTNGATLAAGNANDQYGGGVWCPSTNATISNCVIADNSANTTGGGAYKGTLYNCALSGNSASWGGGARESTLYNCALSGNSAPTTGGGTVSCTLYNCTLSSNSTSSIGGGARGSILYNCTLIGNSAIHGGGAYLGTLYNCTLTRNSADYGGGARTSTLYNCISWGNNMGDLDHTPYYSCGVNYSGDNNIANNPQFVDTNTANYRLSNKSPCINAGTNFSWMSDPADARSKDLDGNRRLRLGVVDMGAYESLLTPGTIFIIR